MRQVVGNDVRNDKVLLATAIFQNTMELMRVYREEIETAKQIEALPAAEHIGNLKQRILPIQERLDRILEQRVQILKDAEAKGIKVPQELYKQ